MGNVRIVETVRNSRLDLIKTAIDAGAGAGTIKVYNGSQPANANTAVGGQTLLATLTMADPCAAAASGGVLTFNAIVQDSAADADGTASWARIADSSGNTVFDCDVGTSGATLNFATTTFVTGAVIQITAFTLTEPAA